MKALAFPYKQGVGRRQLPLKSGFASHPGNTEKGRVLTRMGLRNIDRPPPRGPAAPWASASEGPTGRVRCQGLRRSSGLHRPPSKRIQSQRQGRPRARIITGGSRDQAAEMVGAEDDPGVQPRPPKGPEDPRRLRDASANGVAVDRLPVAAGSPGRRSSRDGSDPLGGRPLGGGVCRHGEGEQPPPILGQAEQARSVPGSRPAGPGSNPGRRTQTHGSPGRPATSGTAAAAGGRDPARPWMGPRRSRACTSGRVRVRTAPDLLAYFRAPRGSPQLPLAQPGPVVPKPTPLLRQHRRWRHGTPDRPPHPHCRVSQAQRTRSPGRIRRRRIDRWYSAS
jgi:hypothetical protein